ncbi:retrovirus-related pol polyprotein from transposon TNT 1-94, partial [Tanacetum coccineum]
VVDDYSRFTWVRFLRRKDEAPEAIIKCIKNIQVCLNATVRNVRTDNRTGFLNQTLREFYEYVGISHQTYVARTPQQNDVVERRNRTIVEAASMASEQFSSGLGLHSMTPATSIQEAAAPRDVVLAESPVSTSIYHDAPSTSIPSTQEQENSPNISQEPKNFKQAMTKPSWIDAMPEEIHEFQRLEV